MSDSPTQLLGEPREVDVVAIERELATLWKSAADGVADAGSAPVIRACALNFVVVTEDERELNELAAVAGEVTVEHPARIFLIHLNQSAAPKLHAWISARCSMSVPGGKQVCCEQITLTAFGPEVEKVPSIVTSLLVADVPSVLLWKMTFQTDNSVLRSFMRVVNRVIIDSSEDLTPLKTLREWQNVIKEHGAHSTFSDLAWTHVTGWRSVVTNAFNPVEMRPLLNAITSVSIEYSSTESPRQSGLSQALLFVSWMAFRLKWDRVDGLQKNNTGAYVGTFRHDTLNIDVRIAHIAPRRGFVGGIESVALETTRGIGLKFAATAHEHCIRLSRHDASASSEEMLTSVVEKSEAELVAEELEVNTRDSLYEEVLSVLTKSSRVPS